MNASPSLLPPLLVAFLAISLPDPAFAAAPDAPSGRHAAPYDATSDGDKPACAARRFGPSHHVGKRSRASRCTDKQASTRISAQQNCRLSTRGPRHVALAAKRIDCANSEAPVYSDVARANESGQ